MKSRGLKTVVLTRPDSIVAAGPFVVCDHTLQATTFQGWNARLPCPLNKG